MATFSIALKTGLFVYAVAAAISYTLWQVAPVEVAQFWWAPMMVLPILTLIPLGRKCIAARRPINPAGAGWKLGLQWTLLFLVLDGAVLWLYDPTLSSLGLLELKLGIAYVVRLLVVLCSGPIAAEQYRRRLRRRLGFFAR